jgi:hypothetical protein
MPTADPRFSLPPFPLTIKRFKRNKGGEKETFFFYFVLSYTRWGLRFAFSSLFPSSVLVNTSIGQSSIASSLGWKVKAGFRQRGSAAFPAASRHRRRGCESKSPGRISGAPALLVPTILPSILMINPASDPAVCAARACAAGTPTKS